MCGVECPYKETCSDFPNLCQSCRNNVCRKRSYYIPDYPIIWWQPYQPWSGTTYIYSNTNNSSQYKPV